MEILKAAKIYGSAHGRLILRNFSLAFAPRESMYCKSSDSTELKPLAVLITMGKKAINAAITTLGVRPKPNQMRNSGANATFGSTCAVTRKG